MTGLPSTSTFTVGGENKDKVVTNRSIAAKFLINPATGEPVQDPVPGGSQENHIYINGIATPGNIANPDNWLIVPENYSIASSESFAAQVATDRHTYPVGLSSALALMTESFTQGKPQDLQRNSAWGVPSGLVVPAFRDAASFHLGFVTSLSGLPMAASEIGGGIANLYHANLNTLLNNGDDIRHFLDHNYHPDHYTVNDTNGPFGLSIDNAENIKAGFQFGTSILNSRTALQCKTASNSATSDQADLSLSGSDHWVLNPLSNQTAESFQQGTDGADEWSIDDADFSVNPVNLPGIGAAAEEGKESFNLNSSLGNTHTPDPANSDASHKSSQSLSSRPAGRHTKAAFDMIDAYENMLQYISVAPLGDALDFGAQPVPAATRFNDQMIEIGKEILAAEHEKARTSPNGGASADPSSNGRPHRSAQEVPDSLMPNAQTVALAAALYKAIHKEAPAPAAQGALAHRRDGPTGHRDDPIIIHRSAGL
jgi:hypothetical protein